MQASKLLCISPTCTADGHPTFSLAGLKSSSFPSNTTSSTEESESEDNDKATTEEEEKIKYEKEKEEEKNRRGKIGRDPIRMFGLLAPQSLRQAQNGANALTNAVISLSNIDAEMKEVEISIRRARKKKLKSEKETEGEGVNVFVTDALGNKEVLENGSKSGSVVI